MDQNNLLKEIASLKYEIKELVEMINIHNALLMSTNPYVSEKVREKAKNVVSDMYAQNESENAKAFR